MDNLVVSSVFTLQDMLSGALSRINGLLSDTAGNVASLSARMGRLAMSMAPVAVAAGVLLLALGGATTKAIAFESAMADVGKVVNFESAAEMQAMSDTILDMSGRIPMAADGIAAIVSSAAQSGIAKESLIEFTEQAAKMGVAFDLTGDQAGKMMADWRAGMGLTLPRVYALADAVNHLSNNMNATAPALGEVMQRVGALAMSCGLGETQVAALGAAFLSAGASPEVASTALKKFVGVLSRGEAMSKSSAEAFASLGFSVTQMAKDMQTDAQGTIFGVLQALADKPKELQMSLLTEMFGEEAIGAIAPLLSNMGNLTQAFELVGDASNYAGSMQAEYDTRSKTTANTLQLLGNRWDALGISIGNAFLPAVNAVAGGIGELLEGLRGLFASPLGQFFLRLTAGLAFGALAVTGFAAVVWGLGAAMPFVAKGATALKGALAGLGAPFWILIGIATLLYLAYKNNFGGIADTLNGWWETISLVVDGVLAVFGSLTGGVGEIRGELAEKIEAAGLVGVITTISRVVQRFSWFFKAVWMEVQDAFFRAGSKLGAIFGRIGGLFTRLGNAIGRLFGGGEVTSGVSTWFNAGRMIGGVFSWLLDVAVMVLDNIVLGLEIFADWVGWVAALFQGDFTAAVECGNRILANLGQMFSNLLDCLPFGLGDDLRGIFANGLAAAQEFCASVTGAISGAWESVTASVGAVGATISAAWDTVTQAFKAGWEGVTSFFDGLSLAECGKKILGTLIDGILSMKDALVEKVGGVFSAVREYLPFSDAKKGPFSDLTASGAAILGTLGQGVESSSGGFLAGISGVFGQAATLLGFGEAAVPLPQATAGGAADPDTAAVSKGISRALGALLDSFTAPFSRLAGVFGIGEAASGPPVVTGATAAAAAPSVEPVSPVLSIQPIALLGGGETSASSAPEGVLALAGPAQQAATPLPGGHAADVGQVVGGIVEAIDRATTMLASLRLSHEVSELSVPAAPAPGAAETQGPPPATVEGRSLAAGRGVRPEKRIIIQTLNLTLPSVTDGQGLANDLKAYLEQFDAGESA